MSRSVVFMGLLATTLLACGGVDAPGPGPDDPAALFVGTSAEDGGAPFARLEDGQELTLEPGAQGGFHVLLTFQMNDEAAARVSMTPMVQRQVRRTDTGQLVSRSQHQLEFSPAIETQGMNQADKLVPLFLCPAPVGIQVSDQTLELEVRVQDESGAFEVSGTARFVPRCPEGDQAEFCAEICAG